MINLDTIELDESQRQAMAAILDWSRHPSNKQVFRLGGFAGSGKTTLLKEVTRHLADNDIRYALVTYMGKASEVLRQRGLTEAQTIHSLIFTIDPIAANKAAKLREEIAKHDTDPEELHRLRAELKFWAAKQWIKVENLDGIDMIIVDEASTVGGTIYANLKSYNKPILAVGDPAQLGPIGDDNPYLKPLFHFQKPDATLTHQHRFGTQVLLGEVADAARNNEPLPEDVIRKRRDVNLHDYDMILVWRNATRWEYITEIREQLGKPLDRPVVGDRIIFWKNNREWNLFNGGTAEVLDVQPGTPKISKHPSWIIKAATERGEQTIWVDQRGFWNENDLLAAKNRSDLVVATHSEAITCHKSQGSAWNNVLVGEHPPLGWKKMSADEKQRFRYTAVTRAIDNITVIGDEFRHSIED